MFRLLTDENFNRKILRGLRRRIADLDYLVVQDAGLSGTKDPLLLELAAIADRVLVSHDVNTMKRYANVRLAAGLKMPGLVLVPNDLSIGRAVNDLEILIACSSEEDMKNQIFHIPL